MTSRVETLTPPNTPKPIGPYNHVAKVGEHISIGGTANPVKFGLSATSALPSNVVGLSEQSPPTVFGFKLGSITTSSAGIAVTGPSSPAPALVTVDFHAQPAVNDQVKLTLNLPDGTSENIALTATTNTPPQPGQFLIGSTLAACGPASRDGV